MFFGRGFWFRKSKVLGFDRQFAKLLLANLIDLDLRFNESLMALQNISDWMSRGQAVTVDQADAFWRRGSAGVSQVLSELVHRGLIAIENGLVIIESAVQDFIQLVTGSDPDRTFVLDTLPAELQSLRPCLVPVKA